MSDPTTSTTQTILDRHDAHMSINYGRYPIAMVRGKATKLYDADGKEYLDLFAGFGGPILGHCHDELVAAVNDQAQTLWHVGNLFHTEPQTQLAELIYRHGFGGHSYFCHSGADANEAAIKLARLYGAANPAPTPGADKGAPRFKIISATNSFHGRSFGTMPATGQTNVGAHFAPLPAGFAHVPFNDLSALEAAIDEQTVAVLLEPIQGEGGIVVPDDDYLPAVRRLCDQRDLLFIVDEVWTGCGRTGRYFAYQHWDIEPDIMTLAKGVGGGLAVGVMCATPHVAQLYDWRTYGHAVHATTLGGNCLAMAAATTVLNVIERDGLAERAAKLGTHIIKRMQHFAESYDAIKDVRGKGLFVGIELDPSAPSAWFDGGSKVVNRCMEQGLLINATQGTVLRLAPALTIEEAELDRGLDCLQQVLRNQNAK